MTKDKLIKEIDFGNTVLCDICNGDFTNKDDKGGILFDSKAVCPKCSVELVPQIMKSKEEHHIKGLCPTDKTFKDWVLELRGGRNTVRIYELQK